MDFMYLITLFICSLFWGYFDGLQLLLLKLKYIDVLKQKSNIKNQNKLNEYFKNANIAKYSIGFILKLCFYISIFVVTIKLTLTNNILEALILILGVTFSNYKFTKGNTFENIILDGNPIKICDKNIVYANIALFSFIVYAISLFIK